VSACVCGFFVYVCCVCRFVGLRVYGCVCGVFCVCGCVYVCVLLRVCGCVCFCGYVCARVFGVCVLVCVEVSVSVWCVWVRV
jgi:hypothetical protein